MKRILPILGILLLLLLAGVGVLAYRNRGALPALLPAAPIPSPADASPTAAPASIVPSDANRLGLSLPEGLAISVVAEGLGKARDLEPVPEGMLLSLPVEGQVVLVRPNGDMSTVIDGLNRPHGIAIACESSPKRPDQGETCHLYVTEEDALTMYDYTDGRATRNGTNAVALPAGGRHWSRSVLLLDAAYPLISIGSACDTCVEEDSRRGTVQAVDLGSSATLENYATGLRNSVFMARRPGTDEIWATEMGRDFLGDELPPDEVNVLERGKEYGWPQCYGDRVRDESVRSTIDCATTEPPRVELPAHSAPLGLAFIPTGKGWPVDYEGDLLVALHGSWNRSTPIGYAVVRVQLDAEGRSEGVEDFTTGWLTGTRATGRPVDLAFANDGTLWISDDKAGRVYRVTPSRSSRD